MNPAPAILLLLIGSKNGKFRVTINGARNKPAFKIGCIANSEILLFRNGYNSRKCFGFDKSGENDEFSVKLEMVNVLTNLSTEMVGRRKKKCLLNKVFPVDDRSFSSMWTFLMTVLNLVIAVLNVNLFIT